jgi:nodulation protein E
MIRAGAVDAAFAGGAEASITYGTLKSWEALRVLAPDTCRPFSLDRQGLVLGEGAAMLVLESMARAKQRGAKIYAEIVGFGATSDASDLVRPSPDGASRAISHALEDAKLNADEVDYVSAHGTGTTANDVIETEVLHRAFGAHARKLAVSSTKAVHGHALGASPALEMMATVLAIKEGVAPPTANYTTCDPECDLDYVPGDARELEIRAAISNSFAFGGLNAVLAVQRA